MKPLILLAAALLAFGLGWLGHAYWTDAGPVAALAAPLECEDADGPSADYSRQLRGRFWLDSANCAGFEFTGGPYVIWRNELTCPEPDTFYIQWLTRRTFVAKEKNRRDTTLSPLVWLYTVRRYDGQRLQLRELWTGVGPFDTDSSWLSRTPADSDTRF